MGEIKTTFLFVVHLLFHLHATLAADPTASIPTSSLAASEASDVSTTRPTVLPVTLTTPPTVPVQSMAIINTQSPTNNPITNTITRKPVKSVDIYSVIDQLAGNGSLTNDSLSYLVNITGDKNNIYYKLLPTVLTMDPRTPIELLEKVLDHPDYASMMMDELFTYPALATSLLVPAFSTPESITVCLGKTLRSAEITRKLFNLLSANPNIAAGAIDGLKLSLQKSPFLFSTLVKEILANPQTVDMFINQIIGKDMSVVDTGLALVANLSVPSDTVMLALMSNLENILPTLEVVLRSPILPNYIFSLALEDQNLTDSAQKLLLSSADMLKSVVGVLAKEPMLAEEVIGLALQHPMFANGVTTKILSQPDLVIKLAAFVVQNSPLGQTFVGQLLGSNLPTVSNLVKFILGQNNSVQLPALFIPSAILDVFKGTTFGGYLDDLHSGKIKTFGDFLSTIKGLVTHSGDIQNVAQKLFSQVAPSIASADSCTLDAIVAAKGLMGLEEWALKFIDASGKPQRGILKGNLVFMGNYDECTEIDHLVAGDHRIEGGYCEFSVEIPPQLFNQVAGGADHIEGVSHDLRLDLCLPKSCSAEKINAVVNTTLVSLFKVGLSKLRCVEDKSMEGDTGAYVAIVIFAILIFLVVIGTLYDIVRQLRKNTDGEAYELTPSEKNGHVGPVIALTKFAENGVEKEINGDIHDDIEKNNAHHIENTPIKQAELAPGNSFLMAFSIRENGRKILNSSPPKGSLTCLNGIRVISMAWIILGHVLTTYSDTLENPTEALDVIKTFSFQPMLNAPLAVDTFFVLSGLLVSYLFVKEISKTKRIRCMQMFMYYFHRFWRLTPLYMLVLLFFGFLSRYIASGPFDKPDVLYRDNCKTYWWRNILYINVLFPEREICMLWSWYLSDDMIFYVVAPLAIIPLALGFTVFGFLIIVLMMVTHIVTYGYFEWMIDSGSQLWHNQEYMDKVYLNPWSRIGVYAVGLALGYILLKTKAKYRFKRCSLLFGWFLSFAVGITINYVTYMAHKDNIDWPTEARIAHETVFRPAWALCVAWVIFTCVNGQGGFINTILSWNFWVPLSRLVYGAYLLHLMIIDNIVDSNKRAAGYLNIFYVAFEFIGIFAFSFAASFIFSLLAEAPFMALEKIMFKKKK